MRIYRLFTTLAITLSFFTHAMAAATPVTIEQLLSLPFDQTHQTPPMPTGKAKTTQTPAAQKPMRPVVFPPLKKAGITAKIVGSRTAGTPMSNYEVGILIKHDPGWNTYWVNSGDSGSPIEIEWKVPRHWKITPLGWPLPKRTKVGTLTTFTYSDTILIPFRLEIPWGTPFESRALIRANLKWVACKTTCVPGEGEVKFSVPVRVSSEPSDYRKLFDEAHRAIPEIVPDTPVRAYLEGDRLRIDFPPKAGLINKDVDFFPLDSHTIDLNAVKSIRKEKDITSLFLKAHSEFLQSPDLLNGIVVADGGPSKKGWAIQTQIPIEFRSVDPVSEALPLEPVAKQSIKTIPLIQQEKQLLTNSSALLFAFLGGLLLNLMPCVFPILSLKILHLVDNERRTGSLALHGFIFGLGVIVCMLALAVALMLLRQVGLSIGWGFQLQTPLVVTILALLFFAFTLNLLGVFEFTAASHLADSRAVRAIPKSGLWSSFSTGLLTVIVASPCTAPFMGAALGYAITQELTKSLLIFTTLGVGIALPWVLLSICPVWTRWLPKPGMWMVTLRRVMAIPMFIATLWLMWVLSRQINFFGLIVVIIAASAAAVFLWAHGREQYGRGRARFLKLLSGVALVCCVAAIGFGNYDEDRFVASRGWNMWSQQAVSEAVSKGSPVIVDFTAAWCVTCQYNKAVALHTDAVNATLRRLNYKRFLADWTNHDDQITKALNAFGRTGVPLYLLYNTEGKVTVLPEFLTEGSLIRALEKNAGH